MGLFSNLKFSGPRVDRSGGAAKSISDVLQQGQQANAATQEQPTSLSQTVQQGQQVNATQQQNTGSITGAVSAGLDAASQGQAGTTPPVQNQPNPNVVGGGVQQPPQQTYYEADNGQVTGTSVVQPSSPPPPPPPPAPPGGGAQNLQGQIDDLTEQIRAAQRANNREEVARLAGLRTELQNSLNAQPAQTDPPADGAQHPGVQTPDAPEYWDPPTSMSDVLSRGMNPGQLWGGFSDLVGDATNLNDAFDQSSGFGPTFAVDDPGSGPGLAGAGLIDEDGLVDRGSTSSAREPSDMSAWQETHGDIMGMWAGNRPGRETPGFSAAMRDQAVDPTSGSSGWQDWANAPGTATDWRGDLQSAQALTRGQPTGAQLNTEWRGDLEATRENLGGYDTKAQQNEAWRAEQERIERARRGSGLEEEQIPDWTAAQQQLREDHAAGLEGQLAGTYADEARAMRQAANANVAMGPGAAGAFGAAAAQVGLGGMQQRQQATADWQKQGLEIQMANIDRQYKAAEATKDRNAMARLRNQMDETALQMRGLDMAYGSGESALGREQQQVMQQRGLGAQADLTGMQLGYGAGQQQAQQAFAGQQARNQAQQQLAAQGVGLGYGAQESALGRQQAMQQQAMGLDFQGGQAQASRDAARMAQQSQQQYGLQQGELGRQFQAQQQYQNQGLELQMAALDRQYQQAQASGDRNLQRELQDRINQTALEMEMIKGHFAADPKTLERLESMGLTNQVPLIAP